MGQNGGREHIDPPQQVVPRDHLVQAKLVKELPLIPVLPPHHRRLSCRLSSRNHCSLGSSSPFSTASVISGFVKRSSDRPIRSLVGGGGQLIWNGEADCLRVLRISDQLAEPWPSLRPT